MSGFNSSAPASGSAPAEALSFAVHSLPSPELPEDRRTRVGRLKMLLVLAVCAAPVVASYFTYFVIRPQGRTNYSELISPMRPLPERLPLLDLQGRAVPAASLKGQWLLVVVAGGGCDAKCEQLLYLQRQLRETLGREKDRVDKIWFVSDGALPRPEVLRAIEVGDPATVLRVPRAALAGWLVPAPGQALEAHLYIVDPMGQWMMRAPPDPEPARLRRDVERLLRASAAWDEPGR
jgi:hypothetical protein